MHNFEIGERVTITNGTFAGLQGRVMEVREAEGVMRVHLTIRNRPVPVELEFCDVEKCPEGEAS